MAKNGIIKRYDKDLILYKDFCDTLNAYRLSILNSVSTITYSKLRKRDNVLKCRLANRLGIRTFDLEIRKK